MAGSAFASYAFTLDGNGNRTGIDKEILLSPSLCPLTRDFEVSDAGNRIITAGSDATEILSDFVAQVKSDAYKFYLGDQLGPNTRINIAGEYSFKLMTTALIGGGLAAEVKMAYYAYSPEIGLALTDVVTTITPGIPAISNVGATTAIAGRLNEHVDWGKVKDITGQILFGE